MQIGIVGFPFSGKSTLFQTITRSHLEPASLSRSEAHYGVIKVPDERLERLTGIFSPRKTVNATIDFVDVAGLKKGDSGSTQFTTNFLSNVKTNDALVQVVRVFANDAVPHPDGAVDPLRDIATFETEFILADLAVLETRVDRLRKQAQKTGSDQAKTELPLLEKCHGVLESGKALRGVEFAREEWALLRSYQLLSIKPMLVALNFDESQRARAEETISSVLRNAGHSQTNVMGFFGKIELEMSELEETEMKVFMEEYGIRESALDTLIREAYALLGLQSFFTVGEDECRAWTIRKGATAQEAAGVIHSDFFNKFIRAEVVGYEDLVRYEGSFAKVKEAGLWRLEGKEYIVRNGDVLSIRHS